MPRMRPKHREARNGCERPHHHDGIRCTSCGVTWPEGVMHGDASHHEHVRLRCGDCRCEPDARTVSITREIPRTSDRAAMR